MEYSNFPIPQIFVRDTWTGTTKLASRANGPAGVPSNGCALKPAISPDGRWVVFEAPGNNLTPESASGNPLQAQIYLRDMQANTTTLVSRMTGANGQIADGNCNWPNVSDDGRYVSFNSAAGNLSPDDLESEDPEYPGDLCIDTFVRDLQTNTTILVSRAMGTVGVAQNSRTWDSRISGNGRHVVWRTYADNLSTDVNSCENVYVRHLDDDTTELVNRANGIDGAGANGSSSNPVISYDGRYIAFASFGDNLSDDDYDNLTMVNEDHCGPPPTGDYGGDDDIFVRDMVAHTTELISRATGIDGEGATPISSNEAQGYAPSYRPAISGDGRYVAFASASHNLSSEDRDDLGSSDEFETGLNVYVRDRIAHTTALASRATGPDGAGVNATALAEIVQYYVEKDWKPKLAISADGHHVAFATMATKLSDVDLDATIDVFMRELPSDPDLISGYSLRLTDPDSNRRRLKVVSKASQLVMHSEVLSTGAMLRVVSATFDNTYRLPASLWQPSHGTLIYYDQVPSGPVRKVQLRNGQLRIDALGAQLGHTMVSNPNPVYVILSIGYSNYCMAFGGDVSYKKPTSYRAKRAPAPESCPS
jgi:Tol biopolymer transport system component